MLPSPDGWRWANSRGRPTSTVRGGFQCRLYQVVTIVKGKDVAVSEAHKRIRESLDFS